MDGVPATQGGGGRKAKGGKRLVVRRKSNKESNGVGDENRSVAVSPSVPRIEERPDSVAMFGDLLGGHQNMVSLIRASKLWQNVSLNIKQVIDDGDRCNVQDRPVHVSISDLGAAAFRCFWEQVQHVDFQRWVCEPHSDEEDDMSLWLHTGKCRKGKGHILRWADPTFR